VDLTEFCTNGEFAKAADLPAPCEDDSHCIVAAKPQSCSIGVLVAFPGRLKSRVTPFRCARWSSTLETNSGPLSTESFSVFAVPSRFGQDSCHLLSRSLDPLRYDGWRLRALTVVDNSTREWNPVYEQIQARKARLRMLQHAQRLRSNVSQTCRFFGFPGRFSMSGRNATRRTGWPAFVISHERPSESGFAFLLRSFPVFSVSVNTALSI